MSTENLWTVSATEAPTRICGTLMPPPGHFENSDFCI